MIKHSQQIWEIDVAHLTRESLLCVVNSMGKRSTKYVRLCAQELRFRDRQEAARKEFQTREEFFSMLAFTAYRDRKISEIRENDELRVQEIGRGKI